MVFSCKVLVDMTYTVLTADIQYFKTETGMLRGMCDHNLSKSQPRIAKNCTHAIEKAAI